MHSGRGRPVSAVAEALGFGQLQPRFLTLTHGSPWELPSEAPEAFLTQARVQGDAFKIKPMETPSLWHGFSVALEAHRCIVCLSRSVLEQGFVYSSLCL